jgi:hypothetical protein
MQQTENDALVAEFFGPMVWAIIIITGRVERASAIFSTGGTFPMV